MPAPDRETSRPASALTDVEREAAALAVADVDGHDTVAKPTNEIGWDGPTDPASPRNWPAWKKWTVVTMIGLFTFMAPMSSSIIAPGVPFISLEFGISGSVGQEMIISIFVLAFAFGPLFMGPLSEVFGRRWVVLVSNVVFLAFNIACGFSQNTAQLYVFRFLAAIGGSAPLAIGSGVISDMFVAEQLGLANSILSLSPSLGPVLGPFIGSFLAEYSTWRWIFHFLSIVDAVVLVAGYFLLFESYAPALLAQKAKKLGVVAATSSHTSVAHRLSESSIRPFILLFTQPIVQIVSLYMAYIYGLLYLVLSTFTQLWIERYHESVAVSGIHYLALGLGFVGANILLAPLIDKIYVRLREKNNGVGAPEFRMPLAMPVSFLLPASLFMYGWTAQTETHWILPDIGIMLFGVCFCVIFQVIALYIVDGYRRYAASAMAAATFLRSVFGFGFPLFAGTMYDKYGYGWGNSILAFVAIAGIPAPFLVYKFGAALRARSTYAAG
ncbi:major facilitator superfamily domain-containing protein [Zopfochytrium polystomum]|nr:major facilitator superfamily domain-containing protein [Zopfochytrium polystomum]